MMHRLFLLSLLGLTWTVPQAWGKNSLSRLARSFPPKTATAWIVPNHQTWFRFLEAYTPHTERPLLRFSNPSLWKKTLQIPKLPTHWRGFWPQIGLAPQSPIGAAYIPQSWAQPSPILWFGTFQNSPRTQRFFHHYWAPQEAQRADQQCRANQQAYQKTIHYLSARGYRNLRHTERIHRYAPGLATLRCPLGGPVQTSIRCPIHGDIHQRKPPPNTTTSPRWLVKEKRFVFSTGVTYAKRKKLRIASTHPRLLPRWLAAKTPAHLVRGFQSIRPNELFRLFVNLKRWLSYGRKQIAYGSQHTGLSRRRQIRLETLLAFPQGLRHLWLSGRHRSHQLQLQGHMTLARRGKLVPFAKTPPTQPTLLQYLPASASQVLWHNLTDPLLQYTGHTLRALSQIPSQFYLRPVAMALDTWALALGDEMVLAILGPNHTHPNQWLLLLQLRNPVQLRKQLQGIEPFLRSFKPPIQRISKSKQTAYTWRSNHGETWTLILHKRIAYLTYQRRGKPLALFQKMQKLPRSQRWSQQPQIRRQLPKQPHNALWIGAFTHTPQSPTFLGRFAYTHWDPWLRIIQRVRFVATNTRSSSLRTHFRWSMDLNRPPKTRTTSPQSKAPQSKKTSPPKK